MFDLIASGNAPLTMTSREIAELTETDVMRLDGSVSV